jgi:gliding motility-associated-like protein
MSSCLTFLLVITSALTAPDNSEFRIIAQKPLTTRQGQPITLQLTDLTIEDEEKYGYPSGFELKIHDGDNYSFSGNTIYPEPNFTGILTVAVRVKKDNDQSDKYELKIDVQPLPNTAPTITGQKTLTTKQNQSITIHYFDLIVDDPDNKYPNDFSMTLANGDNYALSERTVIPNQGYTGVLNIPVTVNDGKANSQPFNLTIQVVETTSVNVAPVISGQTPITISKNSSVTIKYSHLIVTDPDNNYPNGFTITLAQGSNYTLMDRTVTADKDYVGKLNVPVTVNDGNANSQPFTLTIHVLETASVNVAPVISGQIAITIRKDSSVVIQPSHLFVTDPDDIYPNGFILTVFSGNNYSIIGATVTPQAGFTGSLDVPVIVNDGKNNSEPFTLKIDVVDTLSNTALVITGQLPVTILKDQPIQLLPTHLIVIDSSHTYPLGFAMTILAGDNYSVSETTITPSLNYEGELIIPIRISNNHATSNEYNFIITVVDEISLRIPSAFTPNDDNANDTWQIQPMKDLELYAKAIVRIYNKRGLLLFESVGLTPGWDGKSNGHLLPSDLYYFTIEVDPTRPEMNKKGTVMMLR